MNHFRLYIRDASPLMQLFLLIAVTLFSVGMVGSVGILASKTFYGADWEQILEYISDPAQPGAMGPLKLLQLFNTLALFLIPAMIFSQIFSSKPEVFLRLNRYSTPLILLLVSVLFIAFTPITDFLAWINDSIHLPSFLSSFEADMRSSAESQQLLIGQFIEMNSVSDFLYNLVLLAIVPALGEEFFFRGIVQRLLIRNTKKVHLSVWVTGLAFGLMHQQFFAIIPLTILGALLGYIKEWTGSLWASILAHFVNNALIVFVAYFMNYNMSDLEAISSPNLLILIPAFVATGAIIFYFIKQKTGSLPENDDLVIEINNQD